MHTKNEREAETVIALRHTTVSGFHYQCAYRTFLIRGRVMVSKSISNARFFLKLVILIHYTLR